jgi:hypothetical protein
MSEWEKKPSVPNDFKNLIDELFQAPKVEEVKEVKKEVKPKGKKPTKKVVIPEPPQQTKDQQESAVKIAKDEMEQIRKAFLTFTDEVNDTVIYSYLYPYIEDFVEKCRQMQVLIADDVDKDKLTEHGLGDYEQMRKIRGTILSTIQDKYKKE